MSGLGNGKMIEDKKTGNVDKYGPAWSEYLWAAALSCIGILFTLFLFRMVGNLENRQIQYEFALAAQRKVALLKHGLDNQRYELEALKAFFASSAKVTKAQFSDYVAGFLAHDISMQALEWIPRVTESQRSSFIEEAQSQGLASFLINERLPDGKMVPRSAQKEYYPVYYVEPLRGNETALGFDLASDPARLEALTESRDTGKMIATQPIRLVQEKAAQAGFVILLPVYKKGAPTTTVKGRRENLEGFCLAVFRLRDFIDRLLAPQKSPDVDIHIYDSAGPGGERFLYESSGRISPSSSDYISREMTGDKEISYTAMLEVASRKWAVSCSPTPEFLKSKRTELPLISLIGGLLTTGFLIGYVWLIKDRERRTSCFLVEQIEVRNELETEIAERKRAEKGLRNARDELEKRVDERTVALQVANAKLMEEIDERRRAEDELTLSEERYRALVEECFDGIFVHKGAKIVFANSRLYEMLGYDKGELEGLDHWLIYHPDYHAITRERALARMRGEEVPTQYEVRLLGKDGSSFEGEVRARAIGLNGKAGVQVWVRDISERKQTEKRLKDSERKYRELVELANSIILRWTCDGRITFLNEFGQKFFGYSAGEILGRHVVGTIVPIADSTGRDLGPLMDQILADPKLFERNVNENMRRNGERVWIAWTNKIVPDEQGHIAEVLSIGMDITERKKAQEALQQAHDELERRVAERTAELAQAKELAKAADHLKSAFLATMSHELRTPLNSIIGFTGIVLKGLAGPLNTEQSKQLEMVRSSSRHLLALINDVLDISKIEAGQLEVASERFDLHASVNKVVDIVTPLAEKKGLGLIADIASDVDEAVGDQRRVEQILLNLLNNAIKFTDSGEVALKVELVPDFTSRGGTFAQTAVRMGVSDTGIGIRPDDLTTLFQPFRQIESGLSRNYEGTGLGLAICRRLADLMGGDISAESTWTKGSTFSFTLPLEESSQS